jgi:hypothetical protein
VVIFCSSGNRVDGLVNEEDPKEEEVHISVPIGLVSVSRSEETV